MSTATTQIIISGKDHLSDVFATAGRRMGTEIQGMQRHVLGLQNAFVALAGAAALVQMKQAFTGYDTALRDMGKVTDESLTRISAKIGDIPAELGSATEMIQGYYQVISSGITEPAKAMETLLGSSEAAKAAHVAQAEVIKGITKTMAGYAGEITSASAAADLLFTIEKQGQTTFAELIPVIGDVAAISKQLGVEQKEMGAALAAVSMTAGSTSQAATQYRMMLVNLMKPTKDMQEALDAMGVSSGAAAVEQFGLAGTLQRLQQYADKSGVSVAKLFESSEALLSVAALSRNEFAQYNTNLQAMEQRTGAADKAFREWKQSSQAVDDLFRNTMTNTLIKIGEQVMPAVNTAVQDFAEYVGQHDDEIAGVFGEMADFGLQIGTTLVPALRGVGTALTQDVIPAISGVFSGASDLLALVPADYQSTIGGGLIGYALLGPKGALIGATIIGIKQALDDLWGDEAASKQEETLGGILDSAYARREAAERKLRQAQSAIGGDNGAAAQREIDHLDELIVRLEGAKAKVTVVGRTFTDTWGEIERKSMTGVSSVAAASPGIVAPPVSGAGLRSQKTDKAAARAHEKMITDGKKAAEALDKYWTDYEDRRVAAVADTVESQRRVSEENLELQTEFAERYKEVVLGETAFKMAQIEAQADAYRRAGVDEVALAQYVAAEKLKYSREWQDGAIRALQAYADEATNAAAHTESFVTDTMGAIQDGLKQGIMDWNSWGDAVENVLDRVTDKLLDMALDQVSGPLAAAGGDFFKYLFGGGSSVNNVTSGLGISSAKGNVFASPGLHAYANSVVDRPTIFPFARGVGLMGEAGPEAIMPLKRGPDGTLGVRGGGGSNVVVNIHESPGKGGQRQERQEGGTTIIDIMVEQIESKLASNTMRGQGPLYAANKQAFGLSRSPGSY